MPAGGTSQPDRGMGGPEESRRQPAGLQTGNERRRVSFKSTDRSDKKRPDGKTGRTGGNGHTCVTGDRFQAVVRFQMGVTKKRQAKKLASNKKDKEARTDDQTGLRTIIAEDNDFTLQTIPTLEEMCMRHFVERNDMDMLARLRTEHLKKALKEIPTDFPLWVTGPIIKSDMYWERCCRARWPLCDVKPYGGSWKRMFLERNLAQLIELFVPQTSDITELENVARLSAKYVKKLDIRQLLPPVGEAKEDPFRKDWNTSVEEESLESFDRGPVSDHLDLGPIIKMLPNLQELHVTYAVRDCGINFEFKLFGITTADSLLLGQCLEACTQLKVFSLRQSRVDDTKARIIVAHLLNHPGLIELDLSYNMIGDRGAQALGKLISNRSKLMRLKLCDNEIRIQGAAAIGHGLARNTTLTYLDLRLNRVEDDGAQTIFEALKTNRTLETLNLSANGLLVLSAVTCADMLEENCTLKTLDLSSNKFGEDGGMEIARAMKRQYSITEMDLRLSECDQSSEDYIQGILCRNQEIAYEEKQKKSSLLLESRWRSRIQTAHRLQISARSSRDFESRGDGLIEEEYMESMILKPRDPSANVDTAQGINEYLLKNIDPRLLSLFQRSSGDGSDTSTEVTEQEPDAPAAAEVPTGQGEAAPGEQSLWGFR